MENIIKKHWSILKQDPHLSQCISDKPKFTYRRAPSIKGQIAPSKTKFSTSWKNQTMKQLTLIPLLGMFQCKKALCLTCQNVTHGKKSFTHNGKTFTFNSFYNCSTSYVVYCISCPCGLLYVGRTIRALRARFGEHRRAVEVANPKYSVARHFETHHQKNTTDLNVWIVEAISEKFTPAERFQRLCKQETYWIYSLNTLTPHGLNEEIEVHTVL